MLCGSRENWRALQCRGGETLGWTLNELGIVYKYTGRLDKAHASYSAALRSLEGVEPNSRTDELRATLYHNLGGLEYARGDFAAADLWAARGIDLRSSARGADHLAVAVDRAARAPILQELGRLDEAEAILHDVLATYLRVFGGVHHELAVTLHNLATCEYRRGEAAAATRSVQRAVDIKHAVLGAKHPELAISLANLAHLSAELGDPDRARSAYLDAIEILSEKVEPGHPVLAACRSSLCRLGPPTNSPSQ